MISYLKNRSAAPQTESQKPVATPQATQPVKEVKTEAPKAEKPKPASTPIPNTGDVEGASSDILPGMIDKIKKTFEDNKKKFDEKIIWNLPLEIENQINQKVSKNKN